MWTEKYPEGYWKIKTQFNQNSVSGKEQTDTDVWDAVNSQDWPFFWNMLEGK